MTCLLMKRNVNQVDKALHIDTIWYNYNNYNYIYIICVYYIGERKTCPDGKTNPQSGIPFETSTSQEMHDSFLLYSHLPHIFREELFCCAGVMASRPGSLESSPRSRKAPGGDQCFNFWLRRSARNVSESCHVALMFCHVFLCFGIIRSGNLGERSS